MAQSEGISGTAIGAIAVGGVLVYFGIQNIKIQDGLRELLKGQFPKSGEQSKTAPSGGFGMLGGGIGLGADGSGSGSIGTQTGGSIGGASSKVNQFMSVIRAQIGKPYVWAAAGPNTFDCSGLVVYALRQVIKDKPIIRHTTWSFMTWGGAYAVTTPQVGDMVLWSGHMGVVSGNGKMIHAPAPGLKVEEINIAGFRGVYGPVYRRIKF